MGYYTTYSLDIKGETDKVVAAEEALLNVSRDADGNADRDIVDLIQLGSVYCKGYDIDKYIFTVAPKHPDVLFILSGDGEESGDIWEMRWRGEDFEQQTATIPPFTKTSLLTEYELAKRTITL